LEIHQIRYFLAACRTLNFTRAAEECNVTQPSLTRAIQQLESELGGELFARERNLTHLTELGTRMMPLMRQCYESAVSAKTLAASLKSGGLAPLKLALSHSVSISLVLPALTELSRGLKGLELKFLRGPGAEVAEALKKGAADLAVAGPLPGEWERLDSWPLFAERFVLAVSVDHHLANRERVDIEELKSAPIIRRAHCECLAAVESLLAEHGAGGQRAHEANNENDVAALLKINVGTAIVPASTPLPAGVRRIEIAGFDLKRSLSAYAVAGRPRGPAVTTLLKMLRATDWPARQRRVSLSAPAAKRRADRRPRPYGDSRDQ
jgi:DNA-binding transcriptional LysR family regulator